MKTITIRVVLTAICSIVLSACTTTAPIITFREVSLPAIGQQTWQNIGDSIISSVVADHIPGIITSDDISYARRDSPFMPGKLFVIPKAPFKLVGVKGKKSEYEYTGQVLIEGEPTDLRVRLTTKGSETKIDVISGDVSIGRNPKKKEYDDIIWSDTTLVQVSDKYFKQELIYNGRESGNLLFIYREFEGNFIRPAFTQNVKYDLSLGSVIGFKEARFEVVDADNVSITYVPIIGF